MIITNQKSDSIEVVGENTSHTATIDTSNISKLSYILTEGLYKDAGSAVIVEMSNNSIDSIIESGKDPINNPVIVEFKNVDRKYSLSISDKGLGMTKEFFETKFMTLLYSSKGQNSDLIGFFGLGSKSYASLKRTVTFIIRKGKKECKYLCWKGEELIDYDLLYEIDTEEEDGVTFEMPLNDYREYNDYINKAKQKLAYYDTIALIINGDIWDNKIYRHELFQYATHPSYNTMHLVLKDVVYEIDWDKLKISPINLPIALRFSLTDGIIPTPSRESYLNGKETIELIKKRITDVADVLIEKYNNTLLEPVSFFKGFNSIDPHYRYLELTDRKFDISPILSYGNVDVQDVKIEGVKLRPPVYYKNNLYTVLEAFEKRAEYSYRGIWKTKNLYESLDRKFKEGKKVILVDTLVGNVKEYIKENTGLSNIYVSESSKSLHWYKRNILNGIHKSQWRAYIIEFQELVKGIIAEFCEDYRGIEYKQEYLSWLEQRKERIKHDRIVNPGNYKSLNKQEGEVTISYPRNSLIGINKVFEKKVYKIEDLYKLKHVVIVFTEDEKETAQELASLVVKEKVAIIGIREFNKIKHIQQFKTWKDFMGDNKSFKRIVTAILGERMINNYSNLTRDKSEIIQKCLVPLEENIRKIRNYNYANSKSIRSDVASAMLEVAESKNLWDEEMIPTIKNVENTLKTFDFLKYIAKPNIWETDNVKEVHTLIYQMLLFKKKYHNQLENYELVYREPIVETILEEELELETI